MKISDFKKFIREIPFEYQSFDIKYDHWKDVGKREIIESIFSYKNKNGIITISRNDLFQSSKNLREFVIKVLMWGYPTKGRGRNIENFLNKENFDGFISKFQEVEKKENITMSDINELLIYKGLKLSSLSKILYFKRIIIENFPAMILDQKVINAISSGKFCDSEFEQFKGLKYENSVNYYVKYLKFLNELAQQIGTEADRIELFLFEYGSNLKEVKDEAI